MKLDYKLIIILGLSIVIYFIYREVNTLFDKLLVLEEKVKLLDEPKKISDEIQNEVINNDLNDNINIFNNNKQSSLSSTKNIMIDLNTKLYNYDVIYTNLTDSNSKYLEIYSNDNSSYTSIKDNITSNEIDDILSKNKDKDNDKDNCLIFNYMDQNEHITHPENTTDYETTQNPINNIPNNNNTPNNNTPNNNTPDNNTPDNNTPNNNNTPNENNIIAIISDDKSKLLNYETELKNKKVSDIIKIAQENNIEINKKINGIYKKKIKQELINEIIQKKISK